MLKIDNLCKKYKDKKIGPFAFELTNNQTIAIIGKSGSGKSTLVKLITGAIQKDDGIVELDNRKIRKEDFTYISQIGTLFNHLTIKDNLNLTFRGEDKILENTLEEVNLKKEFLYKYPFELSGGERQRVDLVRALISNTKVMILDEALSALDSSTKDDIYEILKKLRQKHNLLIIIITHDLDEALYLGDNIMLLDKGKVVFYDVALNILKSPKEEIKDLINKNRLKRLKKVYIDG